MSINFNHVTNDISASAGSVTIDGSPAGGGFTLGTPVATTSGTSIDFTGIPAGTKQIIISFDQVSTNGTSPFLIQIGDAGGIENTGYLSASVLLSGSPAPSSSTAGFCIYRANAAEQLGGSVILTLSNSATFKWAATGVLANTDSSPSFSVAGRKALSAELDRIRLTTVAGTDTFDLGEVNIAYI